MTFVELVHYFRAGGSFGEFCQSQLLNVDSEVVEIFMAKPLNIANDIKFFEIEKTEGKSEYTCDGRKYVNMFDFYYFLDAIEESNSANNSHITDATIAELLYNYAMKDA